MVFDGLIEREKRVGRAEGDLERLEEDTHKKEPPPALNQDTATPLKEKGNNTSKLREQKKTIIRIHKIKENFPLIQT